MPISISLACAFLAFPSSQDYSDFQNPRITPEVLVAREVAPMVVYIESTRPFFAGFDFRGQRVVKNDTVSGSGVVIEKSGYIVTNYHVVGNDSKRITAQFDPSLDSKVYEAELVSFVEKDDLALLKIEGEREFPEVRRGTSSDLMIGERVIAIGNPLDLKLTVSSGIVSGLHRDLHIQGAGIPLHFTDLIQTDAAINRGNSGGPLLNVLGELVGINTAVNQGAENLGFAIPVDRVEEVLRDHLLAPSSSRAWLGFEVDDTESLCITRVTVDGPAAQAGVEVGYRLLALAGREIHSAEDYRLLRLPILPNQPVKVRVAGAEGVREVVLRGWDRVDGTLFERIGVTVEPCAIGRYRSVRLARVGRGPAQTLGLKVGDVIDAVRVAERPESWRIQSADAFARLVAELEPGTKLEIDVLRDDDGDGRLTREELYKGNLTLR